MRKEMTSPGGVSHSFIMLHTCARSLNLFHIITYFCLEDWSRISSTSSKGNSLLVPRQHIRRRRDEIYLVSISKRGKGASRSVNFGMVRHKSGREKLSQKCTRNFSRDTWRVVLPWHWKRTSVERSIIDLPNELAVRGALPALAAAFTAMH